MLNASYSNLHGKRQREAMNYWLVKSEPFKYSWEQFLKDKQTLWDGVRNYQARNNLRAMKKDDAVLFYHSNEGLAVVGLAKVVTEAYQDPTTENPQWVVVDLAPVETLKTPVTLSDMKQENRLQNIGLIRQAQLSVMPLTKEEFEVIVAKGQGKRL
jgi:predicted RNA-binding protein with PUA-like domain